MTDQVRTHEVRFCYEIEGRRYVLGSGVLVEYPNAVEQAGAIATLAHCVAWKFEEHARQRASQFRPRKAFTAAGDFFFEVAPDEFVLAASFEDAVDSHKIFGGGSSLSDLMKVYPTLKVEKI